MIPPSDRRRFLLSAAALSISSVAGRAAAGQFQTLAGALDVPAGPALDPERRLDRIGLGSCFNQMKSGALLGTALRSRPDLFLFMGDNVYGDTLSPDLDELVGAYAAALARPDYRRFRQSVPMAAIWDDHDFGDNDEGATYAYKLQTRPLFFDFWNVSADSPRRKTGGIYDAFVTGPKGARVQTILLDTRMYRDAFRPGVGLRPEWERYVEDHDPQRTILGPEQWRWLEDQLRQPADLRIVATSYQLIAEAHGWERWGLFPAERERFYALLRRTRASGVVIVSGDRHRGAIYRETRGLPYPLYEMTSSSFNMGDVMRHEEAGPNRLGPTYRDNNVGLLLLDWEKRTVEMQILDKSDAVVQRQVIHMGELTA